ncbi:unnamed protein product [marine sediment metagenome]|uniref:Uncharacterized protein n=1 Tax=marine sediment metagenome TaxID=412755 RepID=X0S0U8_9ZZZZ
MKKVRAIAVAALLLVLTVQANFTGWSPSTTYTNGEPIPASDVQTFELHCNTTPEEFGAPYEVSFQNYNLLADLTPTEQILVHNFVAGTYWCAPTQFSTTYNSRSDFGPEQNFTVTAQTMGFVPNPPW